MPPPAAVAVLCHILALLPALSVASALVADPSAPPDRQPAIGATASGLPRVDIQVPNAAGLSHNAYRRFDVGEQGAILNNSHVPVRTELGGWVRGNPNLARGTASVILNEVNSSNPSRLHGFVEVAGTRARVIVANPSGIACDGCGFINAHRATLSTGRPLFDSAGGLDGFRVEHGLIRVSGRGLDASGAGQATLLARAVEINAGLWAKHLGVITGANRIGPDDEVRALAAAGEPPQFALDIAHLGGMYAERIFLIGTEHGLGVRHGGDIGAGPDGLVLHHDGLLEMAGSVRSEGDMQLAGRGIMQRGTVYGGGALTVEAPLDNDGLMAAHGDVRVQAGQMHNRGTLAAGLNAQGELDRAATLAVAGERLAGTGRLLAGGDVQLTARTLNLAGSRLVARGEARLDTGDDAGLRAVQLEAGEMTLRAGGALDMRDSRLTVQRDLILDAGALGNAGGLIRSEGGLTARVRDVLDNQRGSLTAAGPVRIVAGRIDNAGGVMGTADGGLYLRGNLDNRSGKVLAHGVLTISAGVIDNRGGLIRAAGEVGATAERILNADTAGRDHGIEGRSVSIETHELDNRTGALRAGQVLDLAVSKHLDNRNGLLSSMEVVRVRGRDPGLRRLTVSNQDGTLVAGRHLSVDSASLAGGGVLLSSGDLSLTLGGDHAQTGTLRAARHATLGISGKFDNRSALEAGGSLAVTAGKLDNHGSLRAGRTQVNARNIDNRGLIDGRDTRIDAGSVHNAGRLYGDRLAIGADLLHNNGASVAARERLDLGVGRLVNREHGQLFSAGDLAIGGALDSAGRATGTAGFIGNHSASIEALNVLTLNANRVENTNEHFRTEIQAVGSPVTITEFQGSGAVARYLTGTPGVYLFEDESWQLMTPEGKYQSWLQYDYTRTVTESRIVASDPARLTAGGNLTLDADSVLNDNSRIQAGGTLNARVRDLRNTEVIGQRTMTDVGTVNSVWRHYKRGRDGTRQERTPYRPATRHEDIRLTPTVYQGGFTPDGSGARIAGLKLGGGATGSPARPGALIEMPVTDGRIRTASRVDIPVGGLFRRSPDPTAGYLVETEPAFADYRTWLSSAYLLSQLAPVPETAQPADDHAPARPGPPRADAPPRVDMPQDVDIPRHAGIPSPVRADPRRIDPSGVQKRLGDGFYEQKLVREQVALLTGRRFLNGYANDEAQYRALLDNAVTYARKWDLRPGIALTPEQMARLTSDIVWLVEQDVTLPDGRTIRALVPQVYVQVRNGDLDGSGALIAGSSLKLDLSGDLNNMGTLAGRDIVSLSAGNLKNLGGRITGSHVDVRARTDLDNISGTIDAGKQLSAIAGRDLNLITTTRSNSNEQSSVTHVARVAGLYVTDTSAGLMSASAGRDVNIGGAQIDNRSDKGLTVVDAGRDLNLGTVATSRRQSLDWGPGNWRKDGSDEEVGSTLQVAGDIRLSASRDLNARAATVTSRDGAVAAVAGRDVNLTAGSARNFVDEAHRHTGSNGMLSKKTITTRDSVDETVALGTTFSGKTTQVQAGRDLLVDGSNVVSDKGTALVAGRDVRLQSATDTTIESHLRDEKKSGLFSSGGIGFTIGTQQQTADRRATSTRAAASIVGATEGNVAIVAGETYSQTGSKVVAPHGDIGIDARRVDIVEARENSHSTYETHFKQTGLTVALTSPILSAIETAQQMKRAASQVSDGRLQALAGATTVLAGKNAYDAVTAENGAGATGVNISITVGQSKSASLQTQDSSQGAASTVAAGGNIGIRASGAGKDSNLTVRGSDIHADGKVQLQADNDIALLAGKDTASQKSTNSSSSAGVGVAISVGSNGMAIGITANASAARGKADGSDVNWRNSHVTAGDTLIMQSGGDTTLRGAVVSGRQVLADIGGDLTIESLQDTSKYKSKNQSIGGSVTVGVGFSGSVNVGQQKMNSDYASVTEQTGIRAGDGGFQLDVGGHTGLKGGIIASTGQAVQDGANRLTTGTLSYSDIRNHANYSASSVSLGGGYSTKDFSLKQIGGDATPAPVAPAASGVGTSQDGTATTGGDKVPGSELPAYNGWSATAPIAMMAKGSGNSTTRSGISGGTVVITDEAGQQARTGQSAAEAIAALNRDVSSDKDGSNTLKPVLDKDRIEAGFAIVGALQRETGTFLNNRAKEADRLEQALQKETDPERKAALALQYEDAKKWAPGGDYSRAMIVLSAAAGGNVTGSSAEFLKSAVVNTLQSLGAQQIKTLADSLDSETARAALQGVLACAGAAAQGASCGAGALGASGAVVLNTLLDKVLVEDGRLQSGEEKRAREALVTTVLTGISATVGSGTDAATALAAAQIEIANNKDTPQAQRRILEQARQQQKDRLQRMAKTLCAGMSAQQCASRLNEQERKELFEVGVLVATLAPGVGEAEAVKILFSGTDLTGEEANRLWGVLGIVTGGYGQKARLFSKVGKEVVEAGAAAGRAEKVFLEVGSTREIKLANGFFQAEGAPFKFSEYYYRRLWSTGRGGPFIQAEEVLKTATTVSPDSKSGFYKYTNGFMEMVYNPVTKEVWHLQPLR